VYDNGRVLFRCIQIRHNGCGPTTSAFPECFDLLEWHAHHDEPLEFLIWWSCRGGLWQLRRMESFWQLYGERKRDWQLGVWSLFRLFRFGVCDG